MSTKTRTARRNTPAVVNTPAVEPVVTSDVVAVVEPVVTSDTPAVEPADTPAVVTPADTLTATYTDDGGTFDVVFPPFAVAVARAFRATDVAVLMGANGDHDAARTARHTLVARYRDALHAAHVPGFNANPERMAGVMGANVTRTQNDIGVAFTLAFPGVDPVNASGAIAAMWHACIGAHASDYIGSKWHYGGSTTRDFLNQKHDKPTFAHGGRAARLFRWARAASPLA